MAGRIEEVSAGLLPLFVARLIVIAVAVAGLLAVAVNRPFHLPHLVYAILFTGLPHVVRNCAILAIA